MPLSAFKRRRYDTTSVCILQIILEIGRGILRDGYESV